MIYYFLIVVAAASLAVNGLCSKVYQRNEGAGFYKAVVYATISSVVGMIAMLAMSGFKIEFTYFSVIIAILQTAMSLIYIFMGIKAMSVVNLSLYALFTNAGGMIVPFLYGIIFGGESLTLTKGLCIVLLIVALFIGCGKIKNANGLIYCIIMFLANGLFSAFAAWHQDYPNLAVGSAQDSIVVGSAQYSFIFYLCEATVMLLILGFIFVKKGKAQAKELFALNKPKSSLLSSVLFFVFNGGANLILLIALSGGIDASLQYPLCTGGCMIFSTLISALIGEKPKAKNYVSVGVAFLGLVLLCF